MWSLGEGVVPEATIWAPLFPQEVHTETAKLRFAPEAKSVPWVHSPAIRSLTRDRAMLLLPIKQSCKLAFCPPPATGPLPPSAPAFEGQGQKSPMSSAGEPQWPCPPSPSPQPGVFVRAGVGVGMRLRDEPEDVEAMKRVGNHSSRFQTRKLRLNSRVSC